MSEKFHKAEMRAVITIRVYPQNASTPRGEQGNRLEEEEEEQDEGGRSRKGQRHGDNTKRGNEPRRQQQTLTETKPTLDWTESDDCG